MTHTLTSFAKHLLCFCILILLVTSCVDTGGVANSRVEQERQRKMAALEEENRRIRAQSQREQNEAALASVNHRIQVYQHKSEEWRNKQDRLDISQMPVERISQINACQMRLSDLLNGYHGLHQRLINGQSATEGPVAEALLRLNQQDMDFLEGHCNALLDEIQAMELPESPFEDPIPSNTLPESPEVKKAFEQADYTQVINLYNRQAQEPEQAQQSAQTTLLYAQALIKNYQEDVARGVLHNLLTQTQLDASQNAVHIQTLRLLADLEFASGSYEKAKENYEQLVRIAVQNKGRDEWSSVQLTALQPDGMGFEEARQYSNLLKNYLAYTPKRDGYAISGMAEEFLANYPASRLVPNANQLHRLNQQQAENWLNRKIEGTQDQTGRREATNVVSQDHTGETAARSIPSESILQEKYNKGTALLAEKNYDQAIANFQDLLGTSWQDQARSGIEEASRLAAEEIRKQAAEIYVRAANTSDTENKKKLLHSSREMLQEILDKYPQSGLSDKVRRNLESIERELH